MKKTLAVLLVFAMVASVCGILFVSADEATTDENQNAGAVELVKPEAATELEAALADKVAKEAPADAATRPLQTQSAPGRRASIRQSFA